MLQSVAIGIKTFLRDEHLYGCIAGIEHTLPECQMIIADCGEMNEEKDSVYSMLERKGHKIIVLPFDAGFGAMSNAIAGALERPYLLTGSDDFDFRPVEVRTGIEKLVEVLMSCQEIDIASGRVNNNPYEFNLEKTEYGYKEINIHTPAYLNFLETKPLDYWFSYCDLTVNYSLIRKQVFEKVKWDEDVKIGGGEHAAFFIDCKNSGIWTVYVPDVNINEQKARNPTRYSSMRRRASSLERPCFVKRNIREYILADGTVDYREKV